MSNQAVPPVAKRIPLERRHHGDVVVDDYAWLRDRDDPDTLAYLEAENRYTREVMAHTEDLQEQLFREIKARVQEDDSSVPAPKGAFEYYTRTEEGQQYAIHCRRPRGGGDEEVLLDENTLAEGYDYFALGAFAVSHDHRLLAYSTDTAGAEVFALRWRDLATGRDLPDLVEHTYYGTVWANDGFTLFYTVPDEAMRPHQVWRHRLGTPTADDVCVLEEPDERFFVGVGKTRTERFVEISLQSKVTSEVHLIDADAPEGELRVVAQRRQGVEYSIEHVVHPSTGDRLFIVTNDGAENFRLVEAAVGASEPRHWVEVLPHDPDVKLEGVDAFASHVALYERAAAVERIRVLSLADGDVHVIEQPEGVYSAWGGANLEFDTSVLRYHYTSLVTPATVYDYDLVERRRELRKRQPVLGDFDPQQYRTTRLWARSDGVSVPISVVHRHDVALDGSAPCLLYGYGSYEISIDPTFSSARLGLLDRGFVFAIAHVRGGGELGRAWYEHGKYLEKVNTFTDFVACAEHLVAEGYASPSRLAARGGSAGGLLMGAVANLRPDLFAAVVAEVPFVDNLNTILDPTLPLTVTEWEEWGNPLEDAGYYAYLKSYAPYENVGAKDYPAMLVTAGLNDPRVSYWEPAKWVARLRATRTDGGALLLKTEMGAGHMGPSGRYDAWRDEAFVQAFLIDILGAD